MMFTDWDAFATRRSTGRGRQSERILMFHFCCLGRPSMHKVPHENETICASGALGRLMAKGKIETVGCSPPGTGGVDAPSIKCREASFERRGRGGQFGETLCVSDLPRLRRFGTGTFYCIFQMPGVLTLIL